MFVKFCRVKKACTGDGGEVERALDDVFGIWVTVRSCCEKRIETTLQKSLKFSDYRKSIRKQIRPSSNLILCLFGFVKATKFRDSSEYLQCVQNVLAKSCLPCRILYKPKKFLLSAERPRYKFSVTVLRRICKQRFSQ